jgi:hypothetical protein
MQHSINTAQQDDKPGSGGLNWRQRKKANMRRQALVDGCIKALGGADRVNAIQMEDICRVVDLMMLARHQRAELAGGRAKLADVVKLEGTLARAMKRLNLPEPNAAVPTLSQYLAAHEAEHEHEKP